MKLLYKIPFDKKSIINAYIFLQKYVYESHINFMIQEYYIPLYKYSTYYIIISSSHIFSIYVPFFYTKSCKVCNAYTIHLLFECSL